MTQFPITQRIVDVLNEAFHCDPHAIDCLLQACTPANRALMEHPRIFVRTKNNTGAYPTLGLLGLLNGVAGTEGCRIVAAYNEETHCLKEFRVVSNEEFVQMVAQAKSVV